MASTLHKLLGPRIAICPPVGAMETGETIVIPNVVKGQEFELGEVVRVGDMVLRHDHVRPVAMQEPDEQGRQRAVPYAEEGDLIVYQIPNTIRVSCTYRIKELFGNRPFHIAMQGDVIGVLGKLQDTVRLSIENFTIGGDFVLLDCFTQRDSVILLPDNKTDLTEVRFKVLQKGVGVLDDRYEVGDEVFVERNRANPIILSGKEYVFVHYDYVYGSISGPTAPPRRDVVTE